MSQRYFHPTLKPDSQIILTDQEAQHLSKVMRAEVGDQVEIFDGNGLSGTATITEIRKKEVVLVVTELSVAVHPEGPLLTLAIAPPKGDRLDLIIEKGTELGIDQFEFLQTARTVVVPGQQKINRLEQIALSACKQSRRNLLPKLGKLISFSEWIKHEKDSQRMIVLADPAGSSWRNATSQLKSAKEIVICIGPEGGFTPEEINKLQQMNALEISLAPHILRIETAAVAFASLLAAEFRV